MKKYGKTLIKIVVSSGLLYFIFRQIDKQTFVENFSKLDWTFVPLIVVFLILNYVVSSYRWKSLLVFKGAKDVTVSYLTYLYFVGSFFNNFAPTSIGGDVYKIFRLGKKIKSTSHAFSATFMERFTGVLVLALITVLGLSGLLKYWIVLLLVWMLMGFYIGLGLFSYLATKSSKIKKIYDAFSEYKDKPKVLFWAIVTSVIVQLLAIFTQYAVFLALGVRLPIMYSLIVFPVITLASFFIPSLNGIGVQDALYMNLFGLVGVSTELAISASILYHLFRLLVSLIGGVLYAVVKD